MLSGRNWVLALTSGWARRNRKPTVAGGDGGDGPRDGRGSAPRTRRGSFVTDGTSVKLDD